MECCIGKEGGGGEGGGCGGGGGRELHSKEGTSTVEQQLPYMVKITVHTQVFREFLKFMLVSAVWL